MIIVALCFSLTASLSAPPSIHVETPSFKTVTMASSEVKAKCLVRTVFDAKVTWLMDGKVSHRDTVSQDKNTTHIISHVTLSARKWKQLKSLTCRAEHECFSSTERTVNVAGKTTKQTGVICFITIKDHKDICLVFFVSGPGPAVTAPSVEIRRSLSHLLKGNSSVLECEVTQLSSTDLYITFQANNTEISEKQYVSLPKVPGLHSISRRFTVPPSHWKKDTSFTCKVDQGFTDSFRSKSTGNIFGQLHLFSL